MNTDKEIFYSSLKDLKILERESDKISLKLDKCKLAADSLKTLNEWSSDDSFIEATAKRNGVSVEVFSKRMTAVHADKTLDMASLRAETYRALVSHNVRYAAKIHESAAAPAYSGKTAEMYA